MGAISEQEAISEGLKISSQHHEMSQWNLGHNFGPETLVHMLE